MLYNRNDFPLLRNHPELCYLDSAATTQKPDCVIEAVTEFLARYNANVGRSIYRLGDKADNIYQDAREQVAKFIGATANEIVFTSGATAALNTVSRGYRKPLFGHNKVWITKSDHNSNFLPWLTPDPHAVSFYDPQASPCWWFMNAGIVTLPHISNVLGEINPVETVTNVAHKEGAAVVVDAAQSAGHLPIDVKRLDCDFLAFSGHKMLAMTGVGVLYIADRIQTQMMPVFLGGGTIDAISGGRYTWSELPTGYEAGTPPIVEAVSLAAAIEYLNNLGMVNITEHISALSKHCSQRLRKMGAKVLGLNYEKHGLVSFNLDGIHPHDVAFELDKRHIAVRAGHMCAHNCMEWFHLKGCVRASFHVYNTLDDVDQLVDALEHIDKTFPRRTKQESCE